MYVCTYVCTLDSVACRYFVKRYCRDVLDYLSYGRQAPFVTLSILFEGIYCFACLRRRQAEEADKDEVDGVLLQVIWTCPGCWWAFILTTREREREE